MEYIKATNTTFTVKIPKGSIVKVEGHPVQLLSSLSIYQVDENTFSIEDHVIMDWEEDDG